MSQIWRHLHVAVLQCWTKFSYVLETSWRHKKPKLLRGLGFLWRHGLIPLDGLDQTLSETQVSDAHND